MSARAERSNLIVVRFRKCGIILSRTPDANARGTASSTLLYLRQYHGGLSRGGTREGSPQLLYETNANLAGSDVGVNVV